MLRAEDLMLPNYVFDPPIRPTVAVAYQSRRFPVRRIFCVGRNYAAHAREMGKDPDREAPFFFTKPADAVVDDGATISYPPETNNFQYEIELVVAVGAAAFEISRERALDVVFGYAVGIDLTRRDLQLEARDKGRPWDWGKAFDKSAPIAPIVTLTDGKHPSKGRIWLAVNGEVKQEADIDELVWPAADIISILCKRVGDPT